MHKDKEYADCHSFLPLHAMFSRKAGHKVDNTISSIDIQIAFISCTRKSSAARDKLSSASCGYCCSYVLSPGLYYLATSEDFRSVESGISIDFIIYKLRISVKIQQYYHR